MGKEMDVKFPKSVLPFCGIRKFLYQVASFYHFCNVVSQICKVPHILMFSKTTGIKECHPWDVR